METGDRLFIHIEKCSLKGMSKESPVVFDLKNERER